MSSEREGKGEEKYTLQDASDFTNLLVSKHMCMWALYMYYQEL